MVWSEYAMLAEMFVLLLEWLIRTQSQTHADVSPRDHQQLVARPIKLPSDRMRRRLDDRNQECDPTGHVPDLDFAIQGMLCLEFGPPPVDCLV
jgi:hypothetical protein